MDRPARSRGLLAGAGPAALLAALVLVVACGGSGGRKRLWQLGLPGVESPFVVTSRTLRGDVLDVTLSGGGYTLRSFAPATEPCRHVLETEARVRWVASGQTGAFRRGELECGAVGIGTLHEWRARAPRPPATRESPVPRRPASYRVVYRDEDVVMLRGSFPLATLLGWTELGDTIAVVPRSELCEGPAGRRSSSMEYRPTGHPVLALVSERGLCPVVGLLRPRGTPWPAGAQRSSVSPASRQAWMPPASEATSSKPRVRRESAAKALRAPLPQ